MDKMTINLNKHIIETEKIRVVGNLLFKIKVRKALKQINQEHQEFNSTFVPRFIVAGQRNHLDKDLFILYLDTSLSTPHIEQLLTSVWKHDALQETYLSLPQKRNFISRFYRNHIRVSIENQIKSTAKKISQTPPRGKVATEDQHFLMMMLHLKVLIKKISKKIEKQSIIILLVENRKIHQKRLRKIHQHSIRGFETNNPDFHENIICEIDQLIFQKRILLQRRLLERAVKEIEKWQQSTEADNITTKSINKLSKIEARIEHLTSPPKIEHPRIHIFSTIMRKIQMRRLIKLKRSTMKHNYIINMMEKQQDFLESLHLHFRELHYNALIPDSFVNNAYFHVFNLLRLVVNISIIGLYLYLINLPLFLSLLFLALGLFVFQPISNKISVLLMLPFIKSGGIKRLSYHELNQIIDQKAKSGFYYCALDLPIYTGKISELNTTNHYIERNLKALQNTLSFYKKLVVIYQITSNTSDEKLIDQEIDLVKRNQNLADRLIGHKRVYFLYLHRSSSVAKKVGNILAAHLIKYHGFTDARIYTDNSRFLTTFNKGPLFDRAYGNFADSLCSATTSSLSNPLGNEKIIENILKGEKIPVNRQLEFTFFMDNKNELKPSSLEKGLAIFLHPENTNITILQPEMSIEDPIHEGKTITSAFLRMMRIARDTHNFCYLKSLHTIFQNMSAYYGKGMIRLASYDDMVMNEMLNLNYVDSHDWQESVFNYAVFCSGSDKRISVKYRQPDSADFLLETERETYYHRLTFSENDCIISDRSSNQRKIKINSGTEQDRISQVVDFLDNNIEVGERELISTLGNFIRDVRWLKGDLQMFNTFYPYARLIPAYHRFHLGNIFRRFTNEITLLTWVAINFLASYFIVGHNLFASQMLLFLSLHLVATAFGFAGIDLFLYPISFELKNTIYEIPHNYQKSAFSNVIKTIKKIGIGLWQFPLYLLIAWPRIFLGAFSAVRILLAGIDQPVYWGSASNASISADEISEKGISFQLFIQRYLIIILLGLVFWFTLIWLIIQAVIPSSILSIFNLGIILFSMVFGPFVSYAISRKIEIKRRDHLRQVSSVTGARYDQANY